MWSDGCGSGGYSGASGVATSNDLSVDNIQTVFTMLFGSYFGDRDVTNNFLRAPLASGTVLTSVWAGRPHWYFQHMGMGETIGYSTILSQKI